MTNRGDEKAEPEVKSYVAQVVVNNKKQAATNVYSEGGMTIREKIAAQAMASLIVACYSDTKQMTSLNQIIYDRNNERIREITKRAIEHTDALIAELSKPTEK